MIVAAMQFKIHQVVGDDTFLVFEASKFQHPSTLLNTSANYNIVLKYFEPIREGKPGNDGSPWWNFQFSCVLQNR